MSKPIVKFNDPSELEQQLSTQITTEIERSINTKGFANVAFSGGSTPIGLLKKLAKVNIPWSKVNVTLVDERCLPASSKDSNAWLLNTYLFPTESLALAANFIPLYQVPQQSGNENTALTDIQQALLERQALPFDVLVLGMGEDGHTASLFPCSKQIQQAMSKTTKELLINVTPGTAPFDRISFTLAALLKSKKTFLHLVGAAKLTTLAKAEQGQNEIEMPIRAFLHEPDLDMEIYWAPPLQK